MTLDDGIKRCYRVADRCCSDCGIEHAQLLAWLRELKNYREVERQRDEGYRRLRKQREY